MAHHTKETQHDVMLPNNNEADDLILGHENSQDVQKEDDVDQRLVDPGDDHKEYIVYLRADQGWAWAVCAAVTSWSMVIGGTVKLYGILYTEYLDLYNQGPALTSWVTFTHGIMTLITALIGGYIADVLPHRRMRCWIFAMICLASLCVALAGYMPDVVTTMVMFGLLGVACGLGDPSALSLIGLYFDKLRTLAYGVTFGGGALGGILLPLLFYQTSPYFGFRGSMLILAGVWLHAVLVPFTAFTMRREKATVLYYKVHERDVDDGLACLKEDMKSNASMDELRDDTSVAVESSSVGRSQNACVTAVRGVCVNYGHVLSAPGMPFLFLTLWFGFFAFQGGFVVLPLLRDKRVVSDKDLFWVFTVASLLELVSRIVSGLLVDRAHVPKATVLLVSYALAGSSGIALALVEPSLYVLYAFGSVTGLFGGCVFTLTIPMLIDLLQEKHRGTASGMFPVIAGLAASLTTVVLVSIQTSCGSIKYSVIAQSASYLLGIVAYVGVIVTNRIQRRRESLKHGKV